MVPNSLSTYVFANEPQVRLKGPAGARAGATAKSATAVMTVAVTRRAVKVLTVTAAGARSAVAEAGPMMAAAAAAVMRTGVQLEKVRTLEVWSWHLP
jgi:hypothetical protein